VTIEWTEYDTWTAITAALAAMSCALPGTFLLLRRQSMLGDALSHTALPGIVVAFLVHYNLKSSGWITDDSGATQHTFLFIGAVVAGLLTAFLTETVRKLGRVESSAALGVIYTSLFALGLLLARMWADEVHIDADCILFGQIESCVFNTVGGTDIPTAAVMNGCVLLLNFFLVLLCFKELRISTFDPALAHSLGINSTVMHYTLMAITSVTLVAAFESVGSILVITVLVAPPATAFLLTNRLGSMIVIALLVALLSAFGGQLFAIVTPSLFNAAGFEKVDDASVSGMTAIVCGLIFVAAFLFSPNKGVITHSIRQSFLSLRIATEDILGVLYRNEEAQTPNDGSLLNWRGPRWMDRLIAKFALWRLCKKGLVTDKHQLTDAGRDWAKKLVRSHRLWESYMARHFPLADDHLHETAHRVEHFLDEPILDEIEQELDAPGQDPHGRSIPPSS
jgi:manganese/zinc/iron transport system permease protein